MNKTSKPLPFRTNRTPRLALPAAVILLLLALALLILLSSIAQPAQALCKEPPCINPEPLVGADNSLVVVDEGDTATNTGSFEDPAEENMVPPSNVTLSASLGIITKSGTTSGTWSWSLHTTEVCADEPKTVTITATDSEGASSTTSFSLTVKDSPGTIPAPNSERIAYEASPEERMCDDGRYDIFTIDPAGGRSFNVTYTLPQGVYESFPDYSSDGTKLAFQGWDSDGRDYDIYTIDASGGAPVNVTNNSTDDERPSYSSDGTKIAYVGLDSDEGDYDIYTIDASGGAPVNVTNNSTDDYDPSYSPDGTKIAYVGYQDGVGDEIYTIDANGGTPFQVTNNDTYDYFSHPDYSPDGNKIAYGGSDGNNGEIYTIDASGGTSFQVTSNDTFLEIDPSYSPNGKRIAYSGWNNSDRSRTDREIYTIDASGGTPFQVTNNDTYDGYPSWAGMTTAPDTQAPKVTSTSPTANATAFDPTANVSATFSEEMMASSINPTTFKLFRKNSTKKEVAASVHYDAATHTATLDPTHSLQKGVSYNAVVSTGAKDVVGNPLEQEHGWSFTVSKSFRQ